MDGPRLLIRTRPSRCLRVALLVGGALALVTPWLADIPPRWCLAADLLALVVLARVRLGGNCELHTGPQGWTLCEDGAPEPVEPLPDSTVWPCLTVLRLGTARGHRVLVLLPDSAPAGELPRLRALLRLGAPTSGNQDRVDGAV